LVVIDPDVLHLRLHLKQDFFRKTEEPCLLLAGGQPLAPPYLPLPEIALVVRPSTSSFELNKKMNTMKHLFSALLMVGAITAGMAQDYHFKVEKFGAGTPILMIPGLSSSGDVWDEAVEALEADYECHVVTLPGFAGQPPVQTDAFLKLVGDELLDYLDSNDFKNTIVMGHSLGGFLALYMGTRQSPHISKLIVVDGLPFMGASQNPQATPESIRPMAEMMKNNIQLQSDEQFEATQPAMLATMISSPERIKEAMEWGRKSDKVTVGQAMYELFQWDLRAELDKIEVPTLVLGSWAGYKDYGVSQEMIQRSFDLQFAKLSDKKVILSEEGKHFLMWDDPQWFMNEVSGFLAATR
jgi:pimeloyl-ACP methyl ester carboxylesterase